MAAAISSILAARQTDADIHTFQVEQHIRLVVLEHLRDQFHVHILDVNILPYPLVPGAQEARQQDSVPAGFCS